MYVEFYKFDWHHGSRHYNIIDKKFFIEGSTMNLKEVHQLNLNLKHVILSEKEYFRALMNFKDVVFINLTDDTFIKITKTNIKF